MMGFPAMFENTGILGPRFENIFRNLWGRFGVEHGRRHGDMAFKGDCHVVEMDGNDIYLAILASIFWAVALIAVHTSEPHP